MKRGKRALLGTLLPFSLCALPACGLWSEDEPPVPNIILVSVEDLRADHVSCYGYEEQTSPFMDELAAAGVRCNQVVNATPGTFPAQAELLTGRSHESGGWIDGGSPLSAELATLPELLQSVGYDTAGFFSAPSMHSLYGLDRGFDRYISCMTTTSDLADEVEVREAATGTTPAALQDITGPRLRNNVAAWALHRSSTAAEERVPYFLYLHMFDVHDEFAPPEEYRLQFVDPFYAGEVDGNLTGNSAIRSGMDPAGLEHLVGLYDGEIRFVDSVLRDIFADLKSNGLMENTLVLLVGNQGPDFERFGPVRGANSLPNGAQPIPLILRWPERLEAGQVLEQPLQLVDLLPTLVGLAGHEEGSGGTGRNFAPRLPWLAPSADE